ncbi:GAF domain-containing protein [Komarekiella sp. 'clone 1']|uniref:GAF domain-containing protein n=1 Tax=Komarekiella delphini-convector SJRDD-AB1 TaxID=2593771 RepID=A0AA40VQE9_9NOST|nr:GAF domain-containing protein [Komarekiella delphini-convector]MBD6615870.1 GAF domain-containing protein [Komarekiella delphini-convector SJRDD-AB1]
MTQPSFDKSNSNSATTSSVARRDKAAKSNSHSRLDRRMTKLNSSASRSESLLPQQQWSLKSKATVWAIGLTVLPVLTVGIASYLGSQSITRQITQARFTSSKTDLQEVELALNKHHSSLLFETGVIALTAGAIAAFLANRATNQVLSATKISTALVNRLQREQVGTLISVADQDELVTLQANINLLQEQLPELIWKQEAEAERSQLLMNVTRRIQEALSQEDILRTTVEQVREAFKIDRVVIFRLDDRGSGTFIEEAVAPGLPKTLWATVSDPCFEGGYVEQYRQGRIRAINDIYQANLQDCHIGLLERFAVKANLIAPIFKDNQLFSLLIGHQCSAPRFWQQSEINLFAQIATQVGFALDHAKLVEQIDTRADQAQLIIDITRRIRRSLNEEDVLKITVDEIRKAISTDRVLVYGFDSNWYGTVIAEAVLPGFPKALRANIKDPCFAEGYVEQYQAGRVRATNNIYEAGLSACHISQLEPFAVKANLVAPILKDDQLFGLLVAHQCSAPREWRQFEIDLFSQLAMQVGFALDHARLLQRIDAEGMQTHLIADITRRIRRSLNEEDVLRTTVDEVRKAISTDRVLVYGFDSNWYGTVIAESVLPGFPRALRAKIKDPCFTEGYVEQYQAGRVKATNNIYEAGLSACHISQLEPFAVKANLVAPILKDDQLFGLLIAHQCSAPREWQQSEIDLLAQLAMQVGFALDHARLLDQVEHAYESVESAFYEQQQQKEALQHQASELLRDSETVVETLSSETLSQMESVTSAYNQIQALANSAQEMLLCLQQAERQEQRLNDTLKDGLEGMNQTGDSIWAIRATVIEAAARVKRLDQPSQKLLQGVSLIAQVTSQIKFHVMKIALEAARTGGAGGDASVAEKALYLAQQLDGDIAEIQSLVAEIHTANNEIVALMEAGKDQAIAGTKGAAETQQKLNQINVISTQVNALIDELAQAATNQVETSTAASQSILEVASIANQTSEQAVAVAKSLAKLTAIAQAPQETNS